jgi:hypothetical protein
LTKITTKNCCFFVFCFFVFCFFVFFVIFVIFVPLPSARLGHSYHRAGWLSVRT